MELNREQIIKALEHWAKNFDGKVTDFVTLGQALALIKELTEEDKKLKAEADRLVAEIDDGILTCNFICQPKHEAETKQAKADTIRNIKIQVHNKAIYPSTKGDIAYISLKSFDSIIDGYISTGK